MRKKENPLRFLRYFLIANYNINNERKDAIIREDEIYDWFCKKENAELTGYQEKPFQFVRKLTIYVNHYLNFSQARSNDGTHSLTIYSLKKLVGESFSLHYILLLAGANLPTILFDQFVSQLENFLFFYIFTKTQTKELERNFSLWAYEIKAISELTNQEEQLQKLNDFIALRFTKHMNEKKQDLIDRLKRLTFYSMQKYRIRYLLARLTQHVDIAFRGQKEQGSIDQYFKLDIEHILPQNPKDDLLSTWQAKHPELHYDDYKIRLGNLTLFEKSLNIIASNDFYEKKVHEYAKSGNYLTKSLSALTEAGKDTSITRINKKLSAFKKWEAEDIESRQALLIALIEEICKTSTITL